MTTISHLSSIAAGLALTALGTGTTVAGAEPPTRTMVTRGDARIEVLSQYADVAISTMHTLDGDPTAWATLAAREGFVDCAATEGAVADLIAHA